MQLARPRSVGEILDQAFRLGMRRFGLFAGLTALGVAPTLVLALLFLGLLGLGALWDRPALAAASFGVLLIGFVPALWAKGVFDGGLIHAMAQEELGERSSFREALKEGRRCAWSLVLVEIVVYLAFLCCIVPGVLIWPAAPAVVLERASWTQALSRGSLLRAGRAWQAFGVLAVVTIVLQLVTSTLTFPASFIGGQLGKMLAVPEWIQLVSWVAYAVGLVVGTAMGLFVRAAQVVFYLDLRARKEGLDLLLALRLRSREPAVVA